MSFSEALPLFESTPPEVVAGWVYDAVCQDHICPPAKDYVAKLPDYGSADRILKISLRVQANSVTSQEEFLKTLRATCYFQNELFASCIMMGLRNDGRPLHDPYIQYIRLEKNARMTQVETIVEAERIERGHDPN